MNCVHKVLNAGKYTYTPLLKYIIDIQAMIKAHTLVTWSKNSSTKNLVLSSRQFSEQETREGKAFDGLEIYVHRSDIMSTNVDSTSEEDESNEFILRGSETFLDLDAEGEMEFKKEHHQFLRRHFWMDAVIKILSNPIAIIIIILLLLSYCLFDVITSTSSPRILSLFRPPGSN